MYKGYANSKKPGPVLVPSHESDFFAFPSVEPIRPWQDGMSVISNTFLLNVISDSAETGSFDYVIKATAHVARRGDVISVTSGTFSGYETKVLKTAADLIYVADPVALANGNTFDILRHKYPTVNAAGQIGTTASVISGPVQYVLNSVNTQVEEVTAIPANSRPLPVKVLNSAGVVPDFSTQTTLASVLAKIIAAPATEAKQDTAQTSLTALVGKDFATQTTLASVLAKIIAAPATEAKQDSTITVLGSLGTQTTLAAILAKIISAPSTEAKQDTQNVLTGAVTETAPATDTASSGLNGRLQRVAQNISTLNTKITAVDTTNLSTSALQTTGNTLTGSLTETAPASDTASSGLNGRLQRVAQNITTMIAKLPATLGQKTMAASMAVVLASDQSAVPTAIPGYSFADSAVKNSGTVTNAAWVQLIASTALITKGLNIFDSSGFSLELGFGAAASEVRKLIIPPGGLNGFIPLAIPAGTRISVRAINTTADYTAAELLLTLLG